MVTRYVKTWQKERKKFALHSHWMFITNLQSKHPYKHVVHKYMGVHKCSQYCHCYCYHKHTHTHTFTLNFISMNTQMPAHVHQPPARRLNKNPPTTPDVHHWLSWPLRNILKGCQGNSLGNSSPSCHSCWKRDADDFIHMCFLWLCVCVVKGLNDNKRGELHFEAVSGWMDGVVKEKQQWLKEWYVYFRFFMGRTCVCTVCERDRSEMGASLLQQLISKQLPLKPT